MAKVYQFIANGTEEIEALIPLDVLRRAGVEVVLVSITGELVATSAHGVQIVADAVVEDVDTSDADLLMIPGGIPGAPNLCAHPLVREAIQKQYDAGKLVSAICAGPMIFGSLGISSGKRCTCYPGCEGDLGDVAEYTADLVTVDGNVITGEGPAAAFPYAYTLCEMLCGKEITEQLKEGMRYNHLMQSK